MIVLTVNATVPVATELVDALKKAFAGISIMFPLIVIVVGIVALTDTVAAGEPFAAIISDTEFAPEAATGAKPSTATNARRAGLAVAGYLLALARVEDVAALGQDTAVHAEERQVTHVRIVHQLERQR